MNERIQVKLKHQNQQVNDENDNSQFK